MSLHVCVLGIDGSGKTTLATSLPAILAAEVGICAGWAGETFTICGPDEDHLAPRFHPEGFPLSARLAECFKRLAKRAVDHRTLYPALKLAHLLFQDYAARRLASRYGVAVTVSEGNTLLCAMGRAANYLHPASGKGDAGRSTPSVRDLEAIFGYLLEGRPLPSESEVTLPGLRTARVIYRLCRFLGIEAGRLPDVALFLDVSPETALSRIASRHQKVDSHENAFDLAQAGRMYSLTLDAFERYQKPGSAYRILADELSPGETLRAAVECLRQRLGASECTLAGSDVPLGTTTAKLTGSALWRRVLSSRYIFRYLIPKWFRGAWREPAFVLSDLGHLFLKEGYSAEVMQRIYDQDQRHYAFWDRIFLGYPLHRAVYDRLHILTSRVEWELESRLETSQQVRVLTAPSGFAYDLFRPLESIASRAPSLMQKVEVIATDLDPRGSLAEQLTRRAQKLGIRFQFVRGDITCQQTQAELEKKAPYDVALFVGLSSWLPKPHTVRHLSWLRRNLRDDGLLITDCFTAEAHALSGRLAGYKAHYYAPSSYRAVLDYCGFDGLSAIVESGRNGINHVVTASPRHLAQRRDFQVPVIESLSKQSP
jgi:energy-coupling factor transporter ATP-binding protein EcfA2